MVLMSDKQDEGLEVFDDDFHNVLNKMASRIDPKESRDVLNTRASTKRGFIGKIMDFAILLRKGFQQSWRFMILIQAGFIFLGLAPEVSKSLKAIGIQLSGRMLVIIAIGGEFVLLAAGIIMLLYGGSQRSQFLINQKQNPAQRMNYHFYKYMAHQMEEVDNRLDKLEKEG